LKIEVFDVDNGNKLSWDSYLDPFNSTWINASEYLYGPALKKYSKGRFALKIESGELSAARAIVTYIFFYNKRERIWTSNHL
jgi:hypothetical protein